MKLFSFYSRLLLIALIVNIGFAVQSDVNDKSFHRNDKSMKVCADLWCECRVECIDSNQYINDDKILISLNCHSMDDRFSDKLMPNMTSEIREQSYQTCGRSDGEPVITGLNIWKSDSSAVMGLLNALKATTTALKVINISDSFANQLPNNIFSRYAHLQYLNLANNNLTDFNSSLLFANNNQLISLDLSRNELKSLDLTHFNFLDTLVIHDNRMETIKEYDLFKRSQIKSLLIYNNEWNCDEKLIWFMRYVNRIDRNPDRNVWCGAPEKAKEMSFAQRLSVLDKPICGQCECSLLRSHADLYVNCSAKELSAIPLDLPVATKMVRLENNNIKNITLNLNALNDWRNVTNLHLNNNTIESFSGLEGTKILKQLVALDMAQNRLREIPLYILDQLSHLDELYLSHNPWHCDCKTVLFQGWLQKNFKIVKDVDEIRCAATTSSKTAARNGVHAVHTVPSNHIFSNRILFRISKSELCPQPNEPIQIFDVINCVLGSLIFIIIIKLLYDYWWQRRTGKLPRFFRLNVY